MQATRVENSRETTEATLTDRGHRQETVDETIEETTLSAPDSAGRQYPVLIKKTNRQRRSHTANELQTATNRTQDSATSGSLTDNSRTAGTEQAATQETIKVKTSTPSWVIWLILGVIAALLMLVILILKKYKIV